MAIHGRKRFSIFLACILLSMILSRLVWMQLRTYQLVPSLSTFSAFSYISDNFAKNCRNNHEIAELFTPMRVEAKNIEPQLHRWFMQPSHIIAAKEICAKPKPIEFIIHSHWVCLTLIVLLGIFLTRFLSSSWCLAIFVGATLMSRGALLALIGSYSETLPITLLVTLWFTACIHYMRTLSSLTLGVAFAAISLGTLLSGSFIGLGLAVPCYLLIMRTTHIKQNLMMKGQSQALKDHPLLRAFSPLGTRFSGWINNSPALRRKLMLVWILLTAVLLTAQGVFKALQLLHMSYDVPFSFGDFMTTNSSLFIVFLRNLSDSWIESLDLHSLFSIAVICLWIFSSQLGKVHGYTKEAIIFFAVCFGLLFVITLVTGFLNFVFLENISLSDYAGTLGAMSPSPFLVWLEPIILTLGIIGLYHMLKSKTVSLER